MVYLNLWLKNFRMTQNSHKISSVQKLKTKPVDLINFVGSNSLFLCFSCDFNALEPQTPMVMKILVWLCWFAGWNSKIVFFISKMFFLSVLPLLQERMTSWGLLAQKVWFNRTNGNGTTWRIQKPVNLESTP